MRWRSGFKINFIWKDNHCRKIITSFEEGENSELSTKRIVGWLSLISFTKNPEFLVTVTWHLKRHLWIRLRAFDTVLIKTTFYMSRNRKESLVFKVFQTQIFTQNCPCGAREDVQLLRTPWNWSIWIFLIIYIY